jgi:hypothetical protein
MSALPQPPSQKTVDATWQWILDWLGCKGSVKEQETAVGFPQ